MSGEYLPNPEDESNANPKPDAASAEAPLRPGEFDPLAGDGGDDTANSQHDGEPKAVVAGVKAKSSASTPVLRLFSLSEILSYLPPVGSMLVGESVIELGEIAMLFGPPGSYKGFAVGQLMACGAQGHGQWLGHPVQAQFASLWLNRENGQRRLREEFRKMGLPPEAEKFIHVTDIPAIWNLEDPRLAGEIRQILIEKQIRLFIIDTVSNFTDDEFAKEYAAFFAALKTLLHGLEPRPVTAARQILERLGLPIKKGMKASELIEIFGNPLADKKGRPGLRLLRFICGEKDKYYLGCVVDDREGLISMFLARKDYCDENKSLSDGCVPASSGVKKPQSSHLPQ